MVTKMDELRREWWDETSTTIAAQLSGDSIRAALGQTRIAALDRRICDELSYQFRQPRERSVPCQECRVPTWHVSAVCDDCR